MKKVIRLVMSCLVLINVFMTTAFAAVPSPEVYTSIEQKSNRYHIVLVRSNPMQEEDVFLTQRMLLYQMRVMGILVFQHMHI